MSFSYNGSQGHPVFLGKNSFLSRFPPLILVWDLVPQQLMMDKVLAHFHNLVFEELPKIR